MSEPLRPLLVHHSVTITMGRKRRRCTVCREPAAGHHGPMGARCYTIVDMCGPTLGASIDAVRDRFVDSDHVNDGVMGGENLGPDGSGGVGDSLLDQSLHNPSGTHDPQSGLMDLVVDKGSDAGFNVGEHQSVVMGTTPAGRDPLHRPPTASPGVEARRSARIKNSNAPITWHDGYHLAAPNASAWTDRVPNVVRNNPAHSDSGSVKPKLVKSVSDVARSSCLPALKVNKTSRKNTAGGDTSSGNHNFAARRHENVVIHTRGGDTIHNVRYHDPEVATRRPAPMGYSAQYQEAHLASAATQFHQSQLPCNDGYQTGYQSPARSFMNRDRQPVGTNNYDTQLPDTSYHRGHLAHHAPAAGWDRQPVADSYQRQHPDATYRTSLNETYRPRQAPMPERARDHQAYGTSAYANEGYLPDGLAPRTTLMDEDLYARARPMEDPYARPWIPPLEEGPARLEGFARGPVMPPRRSSGPRTYHNPEDYRSRVPHHIDARAAQIALQGEFVHLEQFLNCNLNEYEEVRVVDSTSGLQLKSSRPRKMLTSMYKWMEAWGFYECLLVCHYGVELYLEMVEYRLFIQSLTDKYKVPHILTYDERNRSALGRARSFHFTRFDQQLYVTIFDASALKAVTKCPKCSSVEHNANECPFRGTGPKGASGQSSLADKGKGKQPADPNEVCIRFQDGSCKYANCRRKHACIICGGPKGAKSCPTCAAKAPQSSKA